MRSAETTSLATAAHSKEVPGARVEEHVTAQVRATGCTGVGGVVRVEVGEECSAEAVDAEEIEAVVANVGRRAECVQDALDSFADALLGRGPALPTTRVGGAGEVEEVDAFGLVELECAGEGLEDGFGDAGDSC